MKKYLMASLMILAVWVAAITWGAPLEEDQGWAQKIFYFHVPSALAMYVGFLMSGFFSILVLKKGDPKLKTVGEIGLELGLVCCFIVLVTGPIWAKPIWGQYWTWEPRLTTTLLLFLIFVAASLSRFAFESKRLAEKAYAVFCIVGCLDIPLVHLSVRFFRGVHPTVLNRSDGLTQSMKLYFLFSVICQMALFIFAFMYRWEGKKKCFSTPTSKH